MPSRDDCIEEILRAAKGRMKRKDVEDHFDEIDARAQDHQDAGDGWQKSYRRAADDLLNEQAVRSAILRRNLRMDALKFRDLRLFVDAAPSARIGIEARLVGVHRQFFNPKTRLGNQSSVAAEAHGAKKDWIVGAVLDMERASHEDPKFVGLDHLFFSRQIEREWALERYELTLGERGNPGKTKNAAALKIAEILEKWDRVRVGSLNAEGAWITSYRGYVTRTEWDPDRLRKAAGGGFRKGFEQRDREAWAGTMARHIDLRRTFGRDADGEKALADMYGGMVTGDHLELSTSLEEPIFPNVAGQVSASRELHFKSGEDWLAANEKFGRFTPTDAWLHSMQASAEHYALMKSFGSKPKEQFEQLIAYAKNKTMGTPERLDLNKWEHGLRNRFMVVSGEANRPVTNMSAGLVNGVMAVQRMAKLGLTPFAMLQDNVTISRELARQGLSFLDRNGSILSGYFRGAEGSAKREVAELLHTGILGRLRGVTARFDVADTRSGTLARLENVFFKITGITAMTENKRADAERMMANWMGRQRGKAFDQLGGDENRMLQSFGIGDREWALLHRAKWSVIEGETYLTPDVAHKLKDADVEAFLRDRGTISERAEAGIAPPSASAVERAKQNLALKLWAYYSERGHFAVLEFGPKERAMLYGLGQPGGGGLQAGGPLNLAMRLLFQFKQFPMAMVTKAWGAEIYGGASRMDKIAGLTELIVSSTLFGMMANYLNQLVKGQDPNSQWRNHPAQAVIAGFLRGGAASIYGDFLLGEWSRHGQQAAEMLLGPSIGQVNQVLEIWADLTHMKKGAATAALGARFVRGNTPGMNMIYTKLAFDHLVFYKFMEWLNPGYLERVERTMKDKQGTEFWLRPTRTQQIGFLPAIGEAVGGRRP